ncbi:hypothetical protein ABPG74_009001 [Tetrahymena malaccensis]
MAEKSQITLGYWNIRGLGQLSRYLLEYTGLKYKEKRYQKLEEWFQKDKQGLGIEFANLPYIIDGDLKLTESHAVNLYIIRKSGKNELLGTSLIEQAKIRELIGYLEDFFRQILTLCFNPQFSIIKQQKFNDDFSLRLQRLENQLTKDNRKWLNGQSLSLPDFIFYEISQYIKGIYPDEFKKLPKIQAFQARFEEIEQIQDYMMSEEYIYAPFLAVGHGAQWTGLKQK